VLETVEDTPTTESAPVADANTNVSANASANVAVDTNANAANINNLPSNVIVVTDDNTTTYTSNSAANTATKIDEAKPPVTANSNR
jgi:hypothetical protein